MTQLGSPLIVGGVGYCSAMSTSPAHHDRFDLSGRVALVTGGSRGIGRSIAIGFAQAGANVVIASRKADACEAVAAEIVASGGSAIAVPTHVGRADQTQALTDAAMAKWGRIDIVVNNAANPLGGPLDSLTPEAFAKAYEVNVLGPLLVCQAALPALKASPCASVINMMSVGAFAGAAYIGLYTSTKAALWNLTRTMAKEWGADGIRVNALAPGPIETDMMAATLNVPQFHEEIVRSTIQGRIGDPDELIGAALLLASDAGSFMTGSVLVVDGGTSA